MSSRNLSIKGKKKGERVAVSNCNIEPLNLLIPGGGPILVPKHKAWPGKKEKTTIAVGIPLADEDYYDAEEEDEMEERPAAEVKSRKVSQAAKPTFNTEKKKAKVACKVDTKKKSTRGDIEERDRKELMQRIKEQEEYIAQLKAKYEGRKTRADAPEETESDVTTTDDATQTSEGKTTDAEATDDTASEKVRNMLKAIRIKAAGADGGGFTPSEDAQILARKEAGESFRIIAGFMKRSKKQISQRYNELVKAGKTAETAGTDGPGEGAADDATHTGENTDAGTTDAEKTHDAEDDAQVADGDLGGLFDFGGLTTALEAVVEEQAETEKKKKDSPAKKSDKTNKKDKNQKKKLSPGKPKGEVKKNPPKSTTTAAEVNGGESGYEGGSEAIPFNAGTRLYISKYARHLLRHQDRIPEADDKFDENDCIMLAMAESHLKHGKWEQIQARFANATGRMVPIEVLKYKLGGGEKPDCY